MAVAVTNQVNQLAEGPRASDVEYHDITYPIHFEVNTSELEDADDGGQRLELTVGNGLSPAVRFSHPTDNSAEILKHPNCDVVQSVEIYLKHNAGSTLSATVPVTALEGEEASANKELGNYITGIIPVQTTSVKLLDRAYTPKAIGFIQTYPGQKGDPKGYLHDIEGNEEISLVTVNPRPPLLDFYNNYPEIKSDASKIISKGNEHNLAAGDKTLLHKAAAEAEARIKQVIGYSDVSNPAKFKLWLEMQATPVYKPTSKKANAKAVAAAPERITFANSHRLASSYQTATSVARRQQIDQEARASTKLKFEGYAKIKYIKAHPNQKMVQKPLPAVATVKQ